MDAEIRRLFRQWTLDGSLESYLAYVAGCRRAGIEITRCFCGDVADFFCPICGRGMCLTCCPSCPEHDGSDLFNLFCPNCQVTGQCELCQKPIHCMGDRVPEEDARDNYHCHVCFDTILCRACEMGGRFGSSGGFDCSQCNTTVMPLCQEKCTGCNFIHCIDCIKHKCSDCRGPVCDNCAVECFKCTLPTCKSCARNIGFEECEECAETYCDDHLTICDECSEAFCVDCDHYPCPQAYDSLRRNPDEEFRKAERMALFPDIDAQAAYLAQRIRQGNLDSHKVELAAFLKDPASLRIHPNPKLPTDTFEGAPDVYQVMRTGNLDQRFLVKALLVFATRAYWLAVPSEDEDIFYQAIKTARGWLAGNISTEEAHEMDALVTQAALNYPHGYVYGQENTARDALAAITNMMHTIRYPDEASSFAASSTKGAYRSAGSFVANKIVAQQRQHLIGALLA